MDEDRKDPGILMLLDLNPYPINNVNDYTYEQKHQ